MTKTNFDKLVRWDADFYKSLTDDECIICLTERQIYLIGQINNSIRWFNTRWIGDKSGMDFNSIAEDLEYRISERMTCQTLTQLANTVSQLSITINNMQNTIDNYIDPAPDFDPETTSIQDNFPDVENDMYTQAFTVSADTCDDDGKNAIYGAAKELVSYIHASNLDALQNIVQLGNFSDQIERLISATPLGLLPLDEMFGYATFILEELLEEYEATVTEELLENVTCDLFCRFVANNCTVDIIDTANYMGQKAGSNVNAYADTFVDILQFAFTGTVSGDTIFYLFSLFQLVAVALADHFFNIGSTDYYLIRANTGLNNPDSDWMTLCDACPPFYRLWTWNFAYGMGDWEFDVYGTLDGDRIKGTLQGDGDADLYQIKHPFDPSWRIIAAKMYTVRELGISNGSDDYSTFKMRPTADDNTGSFNPIQGGFRPNGNDDRCNGNASPPFYYTGANQIWLAGSVSNNLEDSAIYLSKVEILFAVDFANPSATLVTDGTLCS